jgi:hypothetical protein
VSARIYAGRVEHRTERVELDLDRAAAVIAERAARSAASGLTFHQPTWIDLETPWPEPLLTDRQQIRVPYSVGVRITCEQAEAQLVLYASGWADVDCLLWADDVVTTEYVELDDAEQFGALLDRIVRRLTTQP